MGENSPIWSPCFVHESNASCIYKIHICISNIMHVLYTRADDCGVKSFFVYH
jgi:hypothetical protein